MSDKIITSLSGEARRVLLSTGHELTGIVHERGGVWLEVETDQGSVIVSHVQVVAIAPVQFQWQVATQAKSSKSKPAARSGPLLVQDFWTDKRLKQLSEAFLDGLTDEYLSDTFKQSRSTIRDLRKSFEVARGTMDELDISQPTRIWVKRWQEALSS